MMVESPHPLAAKYQLAQELLRTGKVDEGCSTLDSILDETNGKELATIHLHFPEYINRRVSELMVEVLKIEDSLSKASFTEGSFLLDIIAILARSNEIAKALEIAKKLDGWFTQDLEEEAYFHIACAYARQDDQKGVEQAFEKLKAPQGSFTSDLYPQVRTCSRKAYVLIEGDEIKRAKALLKSALRRVNIARSQEHRDRLYATILQVFVDGGNPEPALEVAEGIITHRKRSPRPENTNRSSYSTLVHYLSGIFAANGEVERMSEILKTLKDADGYNAGVFGLLPTMARNGHIQNAHKLLEETRDRNRLRRHCAEAYIYYEDGDLEKAVEILNQTGGLEDRGNYLPSTLARMGYALPLKPFRIFSPVSACTELAARLISKGRIREIPAVADKIVELWYKPDLAHESELRHINLANLKDRGLVYCAAVHTLMGYSSEGKLY